MMLISVLNSYVYFLCTSIQICNCMYVHMHLCQFRLDFRFVRLGTLLNIMVVCGKCSKLGEVAERRTVLLGCSKLYLGDIFKVNLDK